MLVHPRPARQSLLFLAVLLTLIVPVLPMIAAPASPLTTFASPRFQQVWASTDDAVARGTTNRSWTWGPAPRSTYKEFYKQSPNGLRLVQYFDKARMEINNPADATGPLGGVTNGLLVVEMVSGRVKLGDGIGPDEYEQRQPPTEIPVAGDPIGRLDETPWYGTFGPIATLDNGYRDDNKVGQRIGTTLTMDGTTGYRQELADFPGTDLVVYESITGHNVPRVFNDFRNSLPIPALVTFGYPITDAYWVRARVGGQVKDVLVQLFERRSLTYTPSNPAAFQVEMGNVGQHYYAWRGGPGWGDQVHNAPITYASKSQTPVFNAYTYDPITKETRKVTFSEREEIPFSANLGDTTLPNGKRQLRVFGAGTYQEGFVQHLLTSDANDYQPSLSPDRTKVVFVSDRDGNPELYMLDRNASAADTRLVVRLTDTIGCRNQHASWLPDGSGLVYESDCQGGNFELYRGNFNYTQDKRNQIAFATLISPISGEAERLTTNSTDDRSPRVSPNGTQITFTATRDGNPEIYTMGLDGSRQTRLTNNPSDDNFPSWSRDEQHLVFSSNRDGDFEIFTMRSDGSGIEQRTTNKVDDTFPVWTR